ncbi:MAG TPA: hypothetical protein VN618_15595 [Solirubrobacteraceae bacterium]|nr:hypothetical protein [Solirubrobacteraceae bacterium]
MTDVERQGAGTPAGRTGPWTRRRIFQLVATCALLGGAALVASGLSRASRAPGAPGAPRVLYVSPAGSNSGGCTAKAPCRSLDFAYRTAPGGSTVLLRSGRYPGQWIGGEGPDRTAGRVTFRPAPGATVGFDGTIDIFDSHVELRGLRVQDVTVGDFDQTAGRPNPTDVRLIDLRGRNFQIDSATHVTVKGGSWGPASACGGPYGGTNNSIRDITGVVPSDILIEGVAIHDVQSYDLTSCHIEGLAIFAGRRITVRGSRFYGNSIYDVFVQANSGPVSGLLFERNWMAMPVGLDGAENGTVIGFSAITSGVTLRDNRFNYIVSLDDDGLNPTFSGFVLSGNVGVLPYAGCSLRGIVWDHNLWRNGACSGSDVSMRGRRLPYVNGSNDGSLDYRVTRAAPARWRRWAARH